MRNKSGVARKIPYFETPRLLSCRMKRAAKLTLSIFLLLIVCAFAAKLAWDEYQISRAQEHVPNVLKLMDQIGQMPGSTRIPSPSEGPSVNEYAVAVWHHFKTGQPCEYVENYFDSRAKESGFALNSTQIVPSGEQSIYRQGEYEFILIADRRESAFCEFAVSVNWYGAER